MMKENGNIFNDGSLEVEESWWMKDTNGWTFKKDERIWNNFKDNNVFTTTIDYPYLVWCLENGVNVLFTVAGKIMYFKLEN